jgi:hypothetical protein
LFFLVIVGGIVIVRSLGSNSNSTFSYVGSSVKPGERSERSAYTSADAPSPLAIPAAENKPDAAQPADPNRLPVVPDDRKIEFKATLDVVVPDLAAAVAKVDDVLAAAKGYVAKSEVRGDAGAGKAATFTIRVPVENFRRLVKDLKGLGTVARDQVDSEDRTEEIVDVQARVKNLKQEEEVLNKLLKDAAGRLEEVLRLRSHIQAIRGDIERAEGRLSTLSRLTALSTVFLTLKEPTRDPATPQPSPPPSDPPPPPPTYEERVGLTFRESWDLFKQFVQRVSLVGVAATPWLALAVPLGLAGFVVVRRRVRA